MKFRSMVSGHDACLTSVSRTSTMQDFILTAITAAEMHFKSKLDVKFLTKSVEHEIKANGTGL